MASPLSHTGRAGTRNASMIISAKPMTPRSSRAAGSRCQSTSGLVSDCPLTISPRACTASARRSTMAARPVSSRSSASRIWRALVTNSVRRSGPPNARSLMVDPKAASAAKALRLDADGARRALELLRQLCGAIAEGYAEVLPDRVTIFQQPIEEDCEDEDEILARIDRAEAEVRAYLEESGTLAVLAGAEVVAGLVDPGGVGADHRVGIRVERLVKPVVPDEGRAGQRDRGAAPRRPVAAGGERPPATRPGPPVASPVRGCPSSSGTGWRPPTRGSAAAARRTPGRTPGRTGVPPPPTSAVRGGG